MLCLVLLEGGEHGVGLGPQAPGLEGAGGVAAVQPLPVRSERQGRHRCLVRARQHPAELPALRPVQPDRPIRAAGQQAAAILQTCGG